MKLDPKTKQPLMKERVNTNGPKPKKSIKIVGKKSDLPAPEGDVAQGVKVTKHELKREVKKAPLPNNKLDEAK